MHRSTLSACLAALVLAPSIAGGATDTENITITGTRSHQVIEGFVHARAVAGQLTGKIARWQDGICPITVGLRPAFAHFITARLRALAAAIGAPVNTKADCAANMEIVFTLSPQLLLDNVRKHQDVLLGYAETSVQRDRLAKVVRPIQAWYTTATQDLHGNAQMDSGKAPPDEIQMVIPDPSSGGTLSYTIRTKQGIMAVTGSRLGDGLRSTFYNVIIVADPSKLLDYEIGTVADYVGLLALAQINPPERCESLDSLANLLVPGCPAVNALTDSDLAYLRGLYKMSPDANLRSQEDQMTYQMEHSIRGQ